MVIHGAANFSMRAVSSILILEEDELYLKIAIRLSPLLISLSLFLVIVETIDVQNGTI